MARFFGLCCGRARWRAESGPQPPLPQLGMAAAATGASTTTLRRELHIWWVNKPDQRTASAWRPAAARSAVVRDSIGQPPFEDIALTITGMRRRV